MRCTHGLRSLCALDHVLVVGQDTKSGIAQEDEVQQQLASPSFWLRIPVYFMSNSADWIIQTKWIIQTPCPGPLPIGVRIS